VLAKGEDVGRLELVVFALLVILIPFLFGASPKIFGDGDVSWHIAAGRWMIEHRQIPMTDPFSYVAFGKPWIAHEWLSEILMAAVFDAAGYPGLACLVVLSLATTLAIIGLHLRRWATPVELCAVLMLVALVLYGFVLARPMVFTWPILALWTVTLLRARARDGLPPLSLIPLMTLWINLHASFALGLGLLGMFGIETLFETRNWKRFAQWTGLGIACLLAALINPHGIHGVLVPVAAFTSPTIGWINEFRPTTFSQWPATEFALLLLIGISWWRSVRIEPVRILLLLGMLHLALAHVRHQPLFMIIAALVAAPAMTAAFVDRRSERPSVKATFGLERRQLYWIGAAAAAGFAAGAGVLFAINLKPVESSVNPTTAMAHIPAALRDQPVLNEYSMGGPLILRGIRVFMDGRTDLYGDRQFTEYKKIHDGDPAAFRRAYARWRFCWTIMDPDNKQLVKLLDQSREWHRIYSDKFSVMHVRDTCGPYRRPGA
jgi:hypothetical protein